VNKARTARRALPIQRYAKAAGVLAVLSFIVGGFGEAYVPSKLIVASDAAATVANLKSFELMFRLGFVAYLVEACCDIALALIFYVLLKPVHKYVSLLAAFFGLVGTATFAAAELFYYACGAGTSEAETGNMSKSKISTRARFRVAPTIGQSTRCHCVRWSVIFESRRDRDRYTGHGGRGKGFHS
jgi:Domain of unknown function (DUF4386)